MQFILRGKTKIYKQRTNKHGTCHLPTPRCASYWFHAWNHRVKHNPSHNKSPKHYLALSSDYSCSVAWWTFINHDAQHTTFQYTPTLKIKINIMTKCNTIVLYHNIMYSQPLTQNIFTESLRRHNTTFTTLLVLQWYCAESNAIIWRQNQRKRIEEN